MYHDLFLNFWSRLLGNYHAATLHFYGFLIELQAFGNLSNSKMIYNDHPRIQGVLKCVNE